MSPTVTVAIPAYNQAAFLEKAVESALAQNYPQLRVVVSDDHSSDDTTSVIERFRADHRFAYHGNSSNLGRVGNYRKALYQLSESDWYVNLDADDYFTDPSFISDAVTLAMANKDVVAVVAGCTVRDETNNTSVEFRCDYADRECITGRTFLDDVAAGKAQTPHLSTLYDRRIAIGLDFYRSDILSSDFESMCRLALHGNIAYLDRSVAVWRKHGGNTVMTKELNDSIDNLSMPGSVMAYAKTMGIDLRAWNEKVLAMMLSAILVEARQEGRLAKAALACLANYPGATLALAFKVRAVSKHLADGGSTPIR
jgi:glycosyltransferase involved in cell wall biosynthesis